MAAPPTVSSAVPKQEAAPAPLSTDQHAVSYTAHPPPSSSELADSKPSLNKQDKVVYKLQSLHEMRCYSLIYVNMQPSFTVEKSACVIGQCDFGLPANNHDDRTLIWLTFLFESRLENGWVVNKFKPLNIWIKIYKIYFREVAIYHQSIHSSDLAGFLIHRAENFPAFLTSFKFGFFVNHFATLLGFSVWFFKMEFKPLPDYWISDLQSLKLIFILWWRKLGSENMQIPDCFFFDKMAIFT